ncbi:hypothetical protein PF002_g22036 [Phytophthora fragariae]|uniref:Uncharacterized protein n=1 Tax=Phytophthora fragariae TaxID=53985 RepID=A0A6A3XBS4_9STRA|nr:hypothetical protein PF003_g24596 [Phytophthora fragariae]KAE8987249.1 hypothetical protein PF011_g19652 [Phytophthora fragariae]KAE9199792.1 hypothetical protein PF002_g22036 [Phytophthora fragariae]KAE9289105.1 hypothetical protein PF001_g20207 [Phytophthora fragariae]KAE9310537.1 hypothetical protein PF008_g20441 [Phytophthora fragariae]
MEVLSTLQKPRWTARDSVCLGLAVFVFINVVMCLWVAATSMSTARRQAGAVFMAVKNASTIEFNLSLQTNLSPADQLNVTGRLRPRLSECSRRLHFDGRMVVTSRTKTEEYVLMNHRGYRRSLQTSDANATCLTTQDLPPLHTLADAVHTAFRPLVYTAFKVHCKPLQFTFDSKPFVVCAEDWLRARLRAQNDIPVSSTAASGSGDGQWLVVHGKQAALELNVLSSSTIDADQPFEGLNRCEYLEAPMTSGETCSVQPIRCPGPHTGACRKRVKREDS